MVFGERIASHDDRYERLVSFLKRVWGGEEPTACSNQAVGALDSGLRILTFMVIKVIHSVVFAVWFREITKEAVELEFLIKHD